MSEYEAVLFIQLYQGAVSKIEHDSRVIHTSSKGRYVNTTSYGRVYLNADNVAVLSERLFRTRSGHGVRRIVQETEDTVKQSIASLLGEYNMAPDYAPCAGGPSAD